MTGVSPPRYQADEMTIPSGVSSEDLDWVAVVWELAKPAHDGGYHFAQFVMVPGSVILRRMQGDDILDDEDAVCDVFPTPDKGGEKRHPAWIFTNSFLGGSRPFAWLNRPYVCDFTLNNAHEWFMAETDASLRGKRMNNLADVVAYGFEEYRSVFFHNIDTFRPH